MANAAARVLELFLEKPKRGVTGVTHVTGLSVTPESQPITTVTPVTYQKRQFRESSATTPKADAPEQSNICFEERAAIIEYDGPVPRTWSEALARLDPAKSTPRRATPSLAAICRRLRALSEEWLGQPRRGMGLGTARSFRV